MRGENLILTGFMGAGKTSVGNVLAKILNRALIDTDQLIEQEAGMSVSRIFETQGEDAFRAAETRMLSGLLLRTEPAVISVGGGLPLREENREILQKLGRVVFLRVRAETVLKRLAGDTTRPLLAGDHVEQKVRELLAYRNPVYSQSAHVMIDTDELSPGELAQQIADLCKK